MNAQDVMAEYPPPSGPYDRGPDEVECLRCHRLAIDHGNRLVTNPLDTGPTVYRVCPHAWVMASSGSAVCGVCGLSGADEVHSAAVRPGAQPVDNDDEPLDSDVAGVLDGAADALTVAIAMLVEKIDGARSIAVALEQENAEARRHLAAMVALVQPSSWAADTNALEAARAFLDQGAEG